MNVDAANKEREFWQRDSLAFELLKKQTIKQKLDYTHYNPCDDKMGALQRAVGLLLFISPFLRKGINNFKFIKHIGAVL